MAMSTGLICTSLSSLLKLAAEHRVPARRRCGANVPSMVGSGKAKGMLLRDDGAKKPVIVILHEKPLEFQQKICCFTRG
jgi:hypothetical protein